MGGGQPVYRVLTAEGTRLTATQICGVADIIEEAREMIKLCAECIVGSVKEPEYGQFL
jgi:hypothetical protein